MHKTEPLISIILPTYNRSELLIRAIKSVLNQTLQKFEIIIIDDCSTDNTEETVSNINDKRIKYLKLDKNRGVSYARNIGIQKAEGEYIAFIDSDDEWLPKKLEAQAAIFSKSEIINLMVVTCGYNIISKDIRKNYIPYKNGSVLKEFVLGKIKDYQPQCWLINSSFIRINNISFDEFMNSGEDWDFMAQILQQGNLDYTSDILVNIYHGNYERLWSYDRHIDALELQIKKYETNPLFNNRMVAHLYISKANFYIRTNQMILAEHDIKKATKLTFNTEIIVWFFVKLFLQLNLTKNPLYKNLIKLARQVSFN